MATLVEIFDQREVDGELKEESNAEATQLIAELGLKGQLTTDDKRICYPNPNREQQIVLEGLFPAATLVENYAADCIPLRVLKEIRSYKAEHPNHPLVIRHAAPAVLKDPILLAFTNEAYFQYPWFSCERCASNGWQNFRLIARWGDALLSWDKLAEKAAKALTDEYARALTTISAQIEMQRGFIRAGGNVLTARGMPTASFATLGQT